MTGDDSSSGSLPQSPLADINAQSNRPPIPTIHHSAYQQSKLLQCSIAVWQPTTQTAILVLERSVHTKNVGFTQDSSHHLYVEEVLWLLSIAAVEVVTLGGVVLALSDAYALLAASPRKPTTGSTAATPRPHLHTPLQSSIVYCQLRGNGQIVQPLQLYLQLTSRSKSEADTPALQHDVYAVWHSHRAQSFSRSSPSTPDLLVVVVDREQQPISAHDTMFDIAAIFQASELASVPLHLALVDSTGKVLIMGVSPMAEAD